MLQSFSVPVTSRDSEHEGFWEQRILFARWNAENNTMIDLTERNFRRRDCDAWEND